MKRGEKRVGTEQVGAVLCGIGGYGRMYLQALLQGGAGTKVELAGVVDPFAATADGYPELHERKIPVYGTLEDFYKQQRADLAVVCSPIHWHCRQTLLALTQHSHVLCEKPAAATVQEVESMMTARDRAGRQVAVGYQWSFSSAIQALKRDIAAGLFGRPLRLRLAAPLAAGSSLLRPQRLGRSAAGWKRKLDPRFPGQQCVRPRVAQHVLPAGRGRRPQRRSPRSDR